MLSCFTKNRFYLVLGITFFLTTCSPTKKHYQQQLFTFGTIVSISLWHTDASTAEHIIEDISHTFDNLHHQWQAWHGGVLQQLNQRLATGQTIPISTLPAPLFSLIRTAKHLSLQSQHLFNPAIGQLVALWGFHDQQHLPFSPPPPAKITHYLQSKPNVDQLLISKNNLRSTNPALYLDFGAIAKGFALDLILEKYASQHLDILINAGGDIAARGQSGQRPWRIGIRHPRKKSMLAAVELHPFEAIFTSGDYERFYDYQGQRYHHLLDPRTAKPANTCQSVTVIHPNAATADAAATALFIAGTKKWRTIAQKMGIKYVMLVDKKGNIHITPAMEKRIQWQVAPPPPISELPP